MTDEKEGEGKGEKGGKGRTGEEEGERGRERIERRKGHIEWKGRWETFSYERSYRKGWRDVLKMKGLLSKQS